MKLWTNCGSDVTNCVPFQLQRPHLLLSVDTIRKTKRTHRTYNFLYYKSRRCLWKNHQLWFLKCGNIGHGGLGIFKASLKTYCWISNLEPFAYWRWIISFGQAITEKHLSTVDFSLVSYAPVVVYSKPSAMSTLYTSMHMCVEMCMTAGQQYLVHTFDQQLYVIAQLIKWPGPNEFQSHIISLGGFHTVACFIVFIGKLWGDGCLADLQVIFGV